MDNPVNPFGQHTVYSHDKEIDEKCQHTDQHEARSLEHEARREDFPHHQMTLVKSGGGKRSEQLQEMVVLDYVCL